MVDAEKRLLGIVNLEEIGRMTQTPEMASLLVAADLAESDVEPLMPGDELDLAMELFVENDLLALPIVDNRNDRRVIGMIRRYEIASAYLELSPRSRPKNETLGWRIIVPLRGQLDRFPPAVVLAYSSPHRRANSRTRSSASSNSGTATPHTRPRRSQS